MPVENILSYEIISLSADSCSAEVSSWIVRAKDENSLGNCRWLACLNPHSYAVASKDEEFSRALHQADWLVPDGAGVVLASRALRGTIHERVTGSDIFYGVHEELNQADGFRVFFLGSTEEVLTDIKAKMANDYPNIVVAGSYSPPFKPSYSSGELDAMVAAVNAAVPDILWVGMTAPKQEKWIVEMIDRLDVTFIAAIGAVFDFYAGRVKRSHPIFQKLGLEWLPRLIQQPRRLWRRMFISAPVFVWHVIKARFGYHPRQLP